MALPSRSARSNTLQTAEQHRHSRGGRKRKNNPSFAEDDDSGAHIVEELKGQWACFGAGACVAKLKPLPAIFILFFLDAM
jgi:hypothetical protein